MNVVMIMHYFWPRGGGEERHGLFLGRELVRRGHEVTFVVAAYDSSLPETDEIEGISIRRISENHLHGLGFLSRWAWFRRHPAVLDEADVVHCHDPITVTRWYLIERQLRRTLPLHMTIHGYEGWPIPSSAKVERVIACTQAASVITVADLRRFYPGSRVDRVIYGAAELPPDTGRPPTAPERYLAFLGRLAPGHNPLGVIEALAQWRRLGGDPPPLLMFGDGPLREQVRAAIERSRVEVRLMGRTADPVTWLRHAEATFCGGYLSLIEALSSGVPSYCLDSDPVMAECWSQIPVQGFAHVRTPQELGARLAADESSPANKIERTGRGQAWAATQTWSLIADVYEECWSRR